MGILLKSVILNGQTTDIHIEGNRIKRIVPADTNVQFSILNSQFSIIIDGRHKALIPGLINMHTHAAMTLFRGLGDDMPLMAWLEEKIWPNEARLTDEDVYWGAKLACLEMIKSGTTTFFDMYQRLDMTASAVEEMGLRAVLSEVCFDYFKPELTEKCKQRITKRFESLALNTPRIQIAIGPHAVYTVSSELLQWIHAFAMERGLLIHTHLAETEDEVKFCRERFGTTPVRYLHKLGILSPNLIVAHVLYVDEEEIALLAEHGVKVVHNPASNMKLGSGYRFLYKEMCDAGVAVGLGTDGCGSSNNLDMIEAMKLASLLGKSWRKNPEVMTCDEMLYAATQVGAKMLGLEAGRIEEGCLADLCLIDLNMPAFTPNFNFASNLVYAANGSCVDTVICDGKVLMQDKKVPGEDEIMERTRQRASMISG